jgi:hypothetical protein
MLSADNTDDGGRSSGLKARLCFHAPALQATSHNAVDITMIDLLRVGGVTIIQGFWKVSRRKRINALRQ